MERPFSKSHQQRLGECLVASAVPADADLAELRELLTYYGSILETTSERIRSELGVKTTSRIKSTGTILEKLRRSGGSTLKSMQDLAGMRIVGGPNRRDQEETMVQVVEMFEGEDREPKVIDRRENPVDGYSAVHVIVFPNGAPVEVQIRTAWQHEWAEVFEKLADAVGRGIRYREEPERSQIPLLPARRFSLRRAERVKRSLNAGIKATVNDEFEFRVNSVKNARLHAGLIALWEEASASQARGRTQDILRVYSPNLDGLRRSIEELEAARARIDALGREIRTLAPDSHAEVSTRPSRSGVLGA